MRLPVGFPGDGQGMPYPAAGQVRVIVHGGEVVRDDLVTGGVDLLRRDGQVLRCHRLSEDGALRDLAGQLQ